MKKIIISVILFSICSLICVLVGFVFKTSITVLGHVHMRDYALQTTSYDLKKGDKVEVRFKASEGNLGAISLQIRNYNTNERKDDHFLLFRIKEKGSTSWITEHKYYGGQFHDLEQFPFGFGPIRDSKGKTYVVELTSLDGTEDSKLTLKKSYPLLISYYQFDKKSLLSPQNFANFVVKKQLFSLSHPDYYFIALICYSPFLFYLFLLSSKQKPFYKYAEQKINEYLRKYKNHAYTKLFSEVSKNIAIIPLIVLILGDVVFIKTSYIFVTYIIVGIMTYCLIFKKLSALFLLKIGFLSFIMVIFFLLFNLTDSAEKLIGWGIWIFLVSIIYQIVWKKNTT